MWFALYGIVMVVGLIVSFLASPLHIFALLSIMYLAFYVSWARWTGSRNWPWLRSLPVWSWISKWYFPLRYHCAHWDKFKRYGHSYLFVVHPNPYNLAIMVAFGAHGRGNAVIQRISPRVMVPTFLSYLPYVSDVLMWLGGTVHSEEGLKDLLNHNNSVVWCPSGMRDALGTNSRRTNHGSSGSAVDPRGSSSDDLERGSEYVSVEPAPLSVFEFAVKYAEACRFSLVPVLMVGEEDLYTNHTSVLPKGWQDLQRAIFNRTGYPGPLVLTGSRGTCFPRRRPLHCYIGEPIDPSTVPEHEDPQTRMGVGEAQSLRRHFYAKFEDLRSNQFDLPIKYTVPL